MRIVGTGIDIIEISRIEKAAERSSRFMLKVFTPGENSYFESRNNNYCHVAGTFAAKEAVLKALGTGMSGIDWRDVEISREASGMPYVTLHGNAEAIARGMGISAFHLSISHCREYAVAQVIAEGEDSDDPGIWAMSERLYGIESIRALFPPREKNSNKGDYGRAYIVAGSGNMMGAAAMCTTENSKIYINTPMMQQ
jgi:phosphopantetheine--protein transferase-like protein